MINKLGWLALVLFVVGSAVAGHWLMTHAPGSPLTVLALLGPMVALTTLWLWRSGFWLASVALVALLALVVWATGLGRIRTEVVYVLQHAGIHLALAAWFWSSLREGATPLIVQVARRVHPLTPAMHRYAIKITGAWGFYFLGMATVSVLLFLLAPFSAWSFFANALTPVAVVLMFVGEYWLRYRLHPEFERVTMRVAVDAWRRGAR